MTERTETNLWARSSERPFLRRLGDWLARMEQTSAWYLTDFLTVREQMLLESYVRGQGACVEFSGGHPEAERKRALLMPDMWFPELSDFHAVTLKLEAVTGESLSHGSILGSVLGTGLDRRKIGDIWSVGKSSFVMVTEDVSKFLYSEWNSVGRSTISLEMVETGKDFRPPAYESTFISVSSMRIDAVVAHACHWSRADAQTAVTRGLVSLNHVELTKTDESVEVGDIISIRGFGRVKILSIPGKTKKDRFRVDVGVLKSTHR